MSRRDKPKSKAVTDLINAHKERHEFNKSLGPPEPGDVIIARIESYDARNFGTSTRRFWEVECVVLWVDTRIDRMCVKEVNGRKRVRTVPFSRRVPKADLHLANLSRRRRGICGGEERGIKVPGR